MNTSFTIWPESEQRGQWQSCPDCGWTSLICNFRKDRTIIGMLNIALKRGPFTWVLFSKRNQIDHKSIIKYDSQSWFPSSALQDQSTDLTSFIMQLNTRFRLSLCLYCLYRNWIKSSRRRPFVNTWCIKRMNRNWIKGLFIFLIFQKFVITLCIFQSFMRSPFLQRFLLVDSSEDNSVR